MAKNANPYPGSLCLNNSTEMISEQAVARRVMKPACRFLSLLLLDIPVPLVWEVLATFSVRRASAASRPNSVHQLGEYSVLGRSVLVVVG